MKSHITDRVTGVLLLVFSAWYVYMATTFKVTFMADPVGPKAFPIMLGILLGLLSFYLIFKPDPNPTWPAPDAWLRIGLITLSFIGYAYLMVPLGFIVATTLEMFTLSLIFKGPLLKAALGALVFSLFLYGLFDYLLDLSLPYGMIFRGWIG